MTLEKTADRASAWAPLRVTAFRSLWLAQLGSMIGTWMQTVGAQWLLVDHPGAATLVAMVQGLAMLPVLLLALPAGALADIVDRRRLLITVQAFQLLAGATLTALALTDHLQPTTLLVMTFLLGCGTTLTVPGYQALVQELVPREQVPSAAALSGVAMNLARSVGPALAGLLIAHTGVAAVFALHAFSYAVLAGVLWRTPTDTADVSELRERFGGALLAGVRYVRHSPVVRRILLRTLIFVVPGSALWALLPLVAARVLHLGATGYGVLLAALGIGAIAGVAALDRVAQALPPNRLLVVSGLVFAAATAICVLVPSLPLIVTVLVPTGMVWLLVLATLGGTLQVFLPAWVRARGLSVYQMCFAGGQAIGAMAWGVIAQFAGLTPTLVAAAGLLALGAGSVVLWPLRETAGIDRETVSYWPEPTLHTDPELDAGPILVVRTFTVAPDKVPAFLEAMVHVRKSRLRTGATRSAVYRDGADPRHRFIEVSRYPSWAEHLRQHDGRLTGADREIELAADSLAEEEPRVLHLFPAEQLTTSPPLLP